MKKQIDKSSMLEIIRRYGHQANLDAEKAIAQGNWELARTYNDYFDILDKLFHEILEEYE